MTPDDGFEGQLFGVSVALGEESALIGAMYDDAGSVPGAGSAYLFAYDAGSWQQVQKVTAADPASGDEFGRCVGMDGDTGMVGAPVRDDLLGSMFVFRDLNSNSAADDCEMPGILSVTSVNEHSGIGPLPIDVDLTATLEVDSGDVTTESRLGGVGRLEIGFADALDESVGGLGGEALSILPPAAVDVTTSLADGDTTLLVDFAPPLSDATTYAIEMTDAVLAADPATPGDRDFQIRALAGNVYSQSGAGPQAVNALDLGLTGIRLHFGHNVEEPGEATYDVNQDGHINAVDAGCVRLACGVFGNTAP